MHTACQVFIDEETRDFLEAYLNTREDNDPALFVGPYSGKRITKNTIYDNVTKYARLCGFHNPGGAIHEKFTPHCFRHWFTTWTRQNEVRRVPSLCPYPMDTI
jgi:integrase/recombinase XerD